MCCLTKLIKSFVVLSLLFSSLLAQIPDFFDPLYDPEQHILTPEQVKQYHVLSCKIYEHDELINTIVYDHDGRVISDKNGLYYYKYSNKQDRLFYVGIYHRDYGDSIDTYLHYNEDGQLNSIKLKYLNSDSQQLIEFAYYDDGPLGMVGHQIMFPEDNEFTMIETELGYDNTGNLSAVKRSKTVYWVDAKTAQFTYSEIFKYHEGNLNIRETRLYKTDGRNIDHTFRYIYDTKGRLSKICRIKESGNEEDIEWYSYNDKDLPISKKTEYLQYQYDYEFMTPSHLILNISDKIENIELYRYGHQDKYTEPIKTPGKAEIDLYSPDMAFYILKISDKISYPIMLEPGKTVTLHYKDGQFLKVDNDPSNNIIWEIENKRQIMASILTEEGLKKQSRSIIEKFKISNPSLPIYLYYNDVYNEYVIDANVIQFTTEMINKYPLNSIAMKKYNSIIK